jgi:myosin-crossreactive antigen
MIESHLQHTWQMYNHTNINVVFKMRKYVLNLIHHIYNKPNVNMEDQTNKIFPNLVTPVHNNLSPREKKHNIYIDLSNLMSVDFCTCIN